MFHHIVLTSISFIHISNCCCFVLFFWLRHPAWTFKKQTVLYNTTSTCYSYYRGEICGFKVV